MDNNAVLFVSNNKPYNRLQSRGIELMLQNWEKNWVKKKFIFISLEGHLQLRQ